MKNVPIKFRGIMKKGLNTNPKDVFVKGYYFKDIKGVDRIMVVVDGLPGNFPVEPDSVCQLVGYDAEGKEIYEGDTLINLQSLNGIRKQSEWTAVLCVSAELDCGGVFDSSFDKMILKEN